MCKLFIDYENIDVMCVVLFFVCGKVVKIKNRNVYGRLILVIFSYFF